MKRSNSLFKKLVVVAAFAVAPLTAAHAIPTLLFSSPSGNLHPAGSKFTVDVVASGFTDLYAYQFSVNFNPAVLNILGVTEGPFLQTGGATFFDSGTIDNTAGTLSFTFDTLISAVSGVTGSDVLAHLNLTALSAGSSTLALTDVLALDSLLNTITVTTQATTSVVPEPDTVALILGVAAVGLMNRKRRGARAASSR
jgi:general secretion pathway protein D